MISGLLATTVSCAQTTSQTETKVGFTELSVPGDRISYYVSVDASKAPYEVRINDIPLMSFTRLLPMTFPVNNAILSSGQQSIEIVQQQPDPDLQVKVTARVFAGGDLVRTDSLIASSNESRSIFNARVPYRFKGWQASRDLAADASITGKAYTWYKKMATLLREKKGQEFMAAIASAELLSFTAAYLSAEEAQKQHSSWASFIDKGGFEVVDPGQGAIEVVGEGKLLHLVYPTKDAGLAIVSPAGNTTFMDIFLHLPEGSEELQPVMINYRQIRTDFR